MANYWHQSAITLSLLFIYFALATSSYARKQQVMCNEDELSALVKIKESFSINKFASVSVDAYPKLASWKLNGSDCCLWDGVECSEDTGHVIGLDLGSSFMYGPLNSSSSLFHLVHLQKLNLADNDFMHSQIPSAIAFLSQLRSLNLSVSAFSGQIPEEISHLTHLTTLDLTSSLDDSSGNPLLMLQNPSFKHLVQNLTELEELSLSQVNISSQIPNMLANFTSLRFVSLWDCGLHGEFPKDVFHLPKLQFLDVGANQDLSGYLPEFQKRSRLEVMRLSETSFSGQLPYTIGDIKSLNRLDLGYCDFNGSLPASLNNLTKLTTLYLENNLFTGHIPYLESLSDLTDLSLGHNEFDAEYPPNWLGNLHKLEVLHLDSTNLTGTMPSSLSNLTQLTDLILNSNQMSGHIPSWLMNLTKLGYIDFSDNQLQGTIPPTFSQLTNIVELNLNWNNFSGTVMADIFLKLNKLYVLQLGGNKITLTVNNNFTNVTLPQLHILGLQSCNLKVFPDFLRTQNQLSVLFMDHNHIEGQIPEWFWNDAKDNLECLTLSNNHLKGFEHHPHILPWVRVQILDLSNNMFEGSLPAPPPTTNIYQLKNNRFTEEISPLICQLSYLQELDLSYNNLTGKIPSCLGELSNSLSVLVLKGNNFSGTIPNMFLKGSKLKIFDISENQLEGKLPRSLTNCTLLRFLDVADNSLEDVFPTWLGILWHLQILILRSNKFHGEITSSHECNLAQYPKVRIIDLSDNAFTGDLPQEYIQSWTSMKTTYSNAIYLSVDDIIYAHNIWNGYYDFSMTITNKGVKREYEKVLNLFTVVDLSSNKFIGEIPQYFGQLQGLQLLNLSNNYLSGYIPVSFQNLTNLECLDLSQNRLSGEIPQQLAQLTFLSFLNVSYNHLSGPIPKGQQFNTFQNNSYEGNPGLCGEPLSKKCGNIDVTLIDETGDDYEFPSGVDWIVISLGLGSGLVVGLIFGKYLGARHHEWFVEKFGRKQDKLVRLIRKDRRN